MKHPQDEPHFDLDEDLFDFAPVDPSSTDGDSVEDLEEVLMSLRDSPPEDDLLDLPVATGSTPVSAPAPDSEFLSELELEPVQTRVDIKPVVAPAATPTASLIEPVEPSGRATTSWRTPRLSKGLVAVALAVTLINSLLAVVMLQRGSSSGDVRAVSEPHDAPFQGADEIAHGDGLGTDLLDPDAVPIAHAHPVLDEARAQISRGEYAAARQSVYGLLAIIDRLDDPRRSVLEADCQYLIAQSLHLEALARMGDSR